MPENIRILNTVPNTFLDLFNKKVIAHLAPRMPDGSPQDTPVWVDYVGKNIIVDSEKGWQKDRNIRHDPRVAIEIADPDDPYRFLLMRSRVEEITESGERTRSLTGWLSDTHESSLMPSVQPILK